MPAVLLEHTVGVSIVAPGTLLGNVFSRRIRTRMTVVCRPETPLRIWVHAQRDVWADVKRLFADVADTVPLLAGMAMAGGLLRAHISR